MGLITGIASSPYKGVMFVLEQIRKSVDRELYDETVWQQKLLDLQMRYDLGEVDQAGYEAQEQQIMEQLDLINSLWFGETDEEEEEDEEYDTGQFIHNN
ncbi:MAG: gas vesicle protein GvpG [Chloroflexi bacterium]|uniref:Gas vesicle protein GvpG n=1 Tax=Candidatus Chlorohelix allophototropha TaxID=3003348 RepID=A0A8T7M738_9CHLR|nr:gas vesicle protein GvpG [Chloroflexota bacterium]WJW69740.1 gas vesicle protein GvpG [Chloroflexota bacterium L227-S17]